MPRRLMLWISIAVGLYLAWCVLLWSMQGKMLYPAAMAGPGLPEAAIAAACRPRSALRVVDTATAWCPVRRQYVAVVRYGR